MYTNRTKDAVKDVYRTAGTRIVDLERDLGSRLWMCGGTTQDEVVPLVASSIQIINDIAWLLRNATSEIKAKGDCYSIGDTTRDVDWIPAFTKSLMGALKIWEIGTQFVTNTGQRQALIQSLQKLKDDTNEFRNLVYQKLPIVCLFDANSCSDS